MNTRPILWHIEISHYNEKARWALDLKGVERTWDRGGTVAFALGFRSRDSQKVAEVANALASLYVEQNSKTRERQATRTADFLKTQLDEMKKKLEAQEDRIGEYKKRHTGELPQQVESNISVLERLNGQLQLNADRQARAMERRDRLAGLAAGGAPGAVAGASEDVETRIDRLSLELAELRRQYTDNYPDVVRLRQRWQQKLKRRSTLPRASGGQPRGLRG